MIDADLIAAVVLGGFAFGAMFALAISDNNPPKRPSK